MGLSQRRHASPGPGVDSRGPWTGCLPSLGRRLLTRDERRCGASHVGPERVHLPRSRAAGAKGLLLSSPRGAAPRQRFP